MALASNFQLIPYSARSLLGRGLSVMLGAILFVGMSWAAPPDPKAPPKSPPKAATPSPAPPSPAKDNKPPSPPSPAKTTTPAPSASSAQSGVVLPALFEIKPVDTMYYFGQPITLMGQVTALVPLTMCLDSRYPERSVDLTVYRTTQGVLASSQGTTQAPSPAGPSPIVKTKLEPGQVYTFRFNLQRALELPITQWLPGEYRIQGQLKLGCESNQTVPSKGVAHVLLLEP